LFMTANTEQLCEALQAEGEGEVGGEQQRVKCLAGFAGWAAAQLENELRRGVWFVAEAADGGSVAPLALLEAGGRDVWSGALAQLGGEFAALARFPDDHQLVWQHAQETWERHLDDLQRRAELLQDDRRHRKDDG